MLLRSDNTWKCLGYPSQALKLLSDLTRELNTLYASDSGSSSNNVVWTESGFQLESTPGSGEYISPQLSLYGFKVTGTPAISWTSGVTDNVVAKPLISETTQTDFQAGTLTDVVAMAAGYLALLDEVPWDEILDFDVLPENLGTGWVFYGDTSCRSISGGIMHFKDTRTASYAYYQLNTNLTSDSQVIVEVRTTQVVSNSDGWQPFFEIADGTNRGIVRLYPDRIVFSGATNTTYNVDMTAPHTIRLVKDGNSFSVYLDGVMVISNQAGMSVNGLNRLAFGHGSSSGTGESYWDYYRYTLTGASVISYVSSGNRISPVYDISLVGIAASSAISWNATLPAGTSLTIETNLSLDGGATWQGWQVCTDGGPVPGIDEGTDLSNARLQVRQTLSTTDTTVTPQLHDMSIVIRPLNVVTDTTFEVDVSLDGGTTWSGWLPISNGGALPGVDTTTNLDNARFKYRLTLTSNDVVSPVVSDIRIENIISWIDVLYDESSWAAVYDNGAYGISPWTNQVVGWPDSLAHWIWDRASTSSAPVGSVYFRKRFTLAEPKWITVAFACDDKVELYVDSQYLLGNANWKSTFANTIYLSAGDHVIAIKGTNSAAGTAGLLVTVRDAFSGLAGSSVLMGSRLARVFDGIKTAVTFGLRQVRDLVANVYVVDIFNTGPATRKVGDYFLGVRSSIDQEGGTPSPSGGSIAHMRKFPFDWIPFVHQRWKPRLE